MAVCAGSPHCPVAPLPHHAITPSPHHRVGVSKCLTRAGLLAILENRAGGQIEASKCIGLIKGFLKAHRSESGEASLNEARIQ